MTRLPVEWRPLEPPRAAVAVIGEGPIASGLAEGATRRLARGADLRIAVGGGALLVLAEADLLPWAPGATYLGREHGLLLPTTMEPTVPVDLLDVAVRQMVAQHANPSRHVAVLPGRVLTFDIADTPANVAALRKHATETFA